MQALSNHPVSNSSVSNVTVQQMLLDTLSQFVITYDLRLGSAASACNCLHRRPWLSSIDFIQLVLSIESAFGQKFGFQICSCSRANISKM